MSDVTIIMYHYVRDLEGSKFPAIKGRRVGEFRNQLDHIAREFNVITAEQIISALKGGDPLPPKAAWLTFDDGYLDHYTNVFPLLQQRGWQGSFFPPVNTTVYREMLDVNKIHFILAAQPNTPVLIEALKSLIRSEHGSNGVKTYEEYWETESLDRHPYDSREVLFVKRLLQRALPEGIRAEFTDRLFRDHVGVDPKEFANELYMSADHLRIMRDCGMYIGSHGARHYWMDRLSVSEQVAEIDSSLEFLGTIGAPTKDWVMCYPYGANNSALHQVLRDRDCTAALTVQRSVANLEKNDPLMLPRIDTNEVPFN